MPEFEHLVERDAWAAPGPAAFDFRSDVMTRPTASMLAAIQHTTLLNDVLGEDPTTNALEAHLAMLTRHDAALFVLSGTMGNQIALRSHLTQPPYSILCDYRAHILEWEAGGLATLSSALAKGIVPANGEYLTLEDITKHVCLSEDMHACPTRVITLENTLGGTIMPLAEVQRISAFARENAIKLHMDGARLWEAAVAGAGGLDEYASLCDSVTLCFTKGLGAPVGSILVGGKEFIHHARWVRKSIGGGLHQPGVVTAAARVAVDEIFGKGPNGEGGLLRGSHITAKKITAIWEAMGGRVQKPTETNMVWLDLESVGVTPEKFVSLGKKSGLNIAGQRLVVHYQISSEAVERLKDVMAAIIRPEESTSESVVATESNFLSAKIDDRADKETTTTPTNTDTCDTSAAANIQTMTVTGLMTELSSIIEDQKPGEIKMAGILERMKELHAKQIKRFKKDFKKRFAEQMKDLSRMFTKLLFMFKAAKASKNLGLKAHATFSGTLAWPYLYPWPQRPTSLVYQAFAELGRRWKPILDAFDTQGFINIYHESIKIFHVKDAEFRPNGRQGVYGGYSDWTDRAGRLRALGDGQVDFKQIFTRLAKYDYEGWAVLEAECAFKDPIVCAREGAVFIQHAIVPVTQSAFDDFAGSALQEGDIESMLGNKKS